MSTASKNAILRALLDGAITELMVKTTGENVYLDENTTLSSKLAELIVSLNAKATSSDLQTGLSERPTKTEMDTAISTAISGLVNGAPETYDTLKEVADYISSHSDVTEALTSAIGNKADKTTVDAIQKVVDGLGSLSTKNTIAESDLDSNLQSKISNAYAANHTHANKTVLDGITAAKVTAWDSKSRVLVSANQPSDLTEQDLWVQI